MGSGCGNVNGEVQKISESRDVDDPPSNSQETGQISHEDADPHTQEGVEGIVVGNAVGIREVTVCPEIVRGACSLIPVAGLGLKNDENRCREENHAEDQVEQVSWHMTGVECAQHGPRNRGTCEEEP